VSNPAGVTSAKGSDRKIFGQEAPSWLWRAIQARRQDAIRDGDTHTRLLGDQDLDAAELHKPEASGRCRGCLGMEQWPCRQARVLLRRHRGDVGWRPHWDEFIREAS
jgi:hypothetical protein